MILLWYLSLKRWYEIVSRTIFVVYGPMHRLAIPINFEDCLSFVICMSFSDNMSDVQTWCLIFFILLVIIKTFNRITSSFSALLQKCILRWRMISNSFIVNVLTFKNNIVIWYEICFKQYRPTSIPNIPNLNILSTLIFKIWQTILNMYLADLIAMKTEIRQKFIFKSRWE